MPVPPSRGFCKIKFFQALALGFSIAGICPALLAAQSVGESMVAADSGVRSPIFNDNLPSQETAHARDRLRDLYSGSELDTYSKEPENNIPEFDRSTQSEAETLAHLPNRGENRQEFPIPNPLPRNLPPLPEPAPPAPLPEQLLPPAVPAPPQLAELPNIPGTIKVDRFEVVGSTVFGKQELEAALKDFVGSPLTFAQLLQARSAVSQLYISKGYHIWNPDWATNAHRVSCEDISAKRQARKYKCSRD
ncbi:POTRA domain-containing protein [Microcoleus sp. AR_TQ3_B6]|uniref:POTRA domain-containing protein n=1 Tax=Microcoleus sp. AR_TQ3_B6 TaxID=3055284 RepID=UPI002FD261D6